ncbi:MAG: PDZ domain-containing protein [Bryobacterales bacterium]|nr:PDZ domain-containing protein [Bryobacterales bacterium]
MKTQLVIGAAWLAAFGLLTPASAQQDEETRRQFEEVRKQADEVRKQADEARKQSQETRRQAKEYAKQARVARTMAVSRGARSFLGIGVADIDSERAKTLKLKEERGVEVKSVDEDSPAAKAGLKEGDVVLEFNGQRVEGTEQFMRLVRETPPGRQARLLISRGGAAQTVTATLGSRKGGSVFIGGEPFQFDMPEIRIPPMPPMPPDIPRAVMSYRTGRLGIESESLSSQLAEYFGVKEGVLVRSVTKDSPAARAGIKAGDVIVKVDGTTVTSPREISSTLRAARSKKTFPVTLMRDRKEMTLTVTVEEAESFRGEAAPVIWSGEFDMPLGFDFPRGFSFVQ